MPPPQGRADLHNHTTASDGTLTPAEQVRWAASQGLAAVGITDHDTIAGWAEAKEAAEEAGIELVPGCELSTEVGGTEVHILAYYFDPEDPGMADLLRRMRGGRRKRVEEAVAKLHALGYADVSLERILARGGESVGRPHIAAELVDLGIVRTLKEAFERFLAQGRPAYVPRPKLEPAEAIAVVRQAGGVPVLAHPGLIGDDRWVREAIAAGVMGIEAYHTDHSELQRQFYARWGHDAGLVVTGGTDSHGPQGTRTVVPGTVNVGMDVVERLKALSLWYQRSRGSLA
ncbi:MAG: PHP domain-containing protein [Symbiobacterium thermophilum]|uniref:PHP domain-containing protein n=2 Tax=Symbiobacterium thermophilum TaxID=2734 RepID=A0A953I8N1_SYMTR|nr:PHP domain-containing protein [Symbiobacterium thermophilum]